jgi:hypothetical protein
MSSRREVVAAIESQPHSATVLVSDGFKLLASRDGHGDSAVLLLLDVDLAERIAEGFPYNARPELSPTIRAALRKKAKAERAKNRAAKRKQAAKTSGPDGPKVGPPREGASRPTEPRRKALTRSAAPYEPEPPAPQIPGQTSMRIEVV